MKRLARQTRTNSLPTRRPPDPAFAFHTEKQKTKKSGETRINYTQTPLAAWPPAHEISAREIERQLAAAHGMKRELEIQQIQAEGQTKKDPAPLFGHALAERRRAALAQLDERARTLQNELEKRKNPKSAKPTTRHDPTQIRETKINGRPYNYPPKTLDQKKAVLLAVRDELSQLGPRLYEMQSWTRPRNRKDAALQDALIRAREQRQKWLLEVENWLWSEGIRPD